MCGSFSTPAILMHTTGKNATDGNAASNDTKGRSLSCKLTRCPSGDAWQACADGFLPSPNPLPFLSRCRLGRIGGAGEAKKEGKESVELEKYWQVVRTNPADFTGWTYLLQYVEQENSLAAAREAFDKFFSYYPYCYGYWKKYAEMEKQLCSIEKAEETFERGVAAIPLSVDLWIYYINFVKVHFKDEDHYYSKVKNLFERAIESSGQDFRSDRLWDMFVTWELENKNLKEVTAIYERVLQVPTQLYGHQFEKFQEHVKTHLPKDILSTDEFLELRQQYMESMRKAVPGGADSAGGVGDEGGAPRPGVDAPPPGVEDATKEDTRALKNDNEARYIRDKVVEKRRVDFKANEAEVGRRWAFEEGIKRPYFLVQPLERLQLKNWREYLDFETQNGNHARTVTLYERCLIACALYEDMWLKYIKYLDTAEPKKVNSVFRGACTTHLVRKPSISLAWAAYEEKHGRFEEASQILANLEERIPDLLEPVLRRINVERRRGCPEKVEELYRKCISQADNVALKSHYAGKLARFLSKVGRLRQRCCLRHDPPPLHLLHAGGLRRAFRGGRHDVLEKKLQLHVEEEREKGHRVSCEDIQTKAQQLALRGGIGRSAFKAMSNHSLCPTGPDSWCCHNAAKAKGEPAPKHRYNLPPHVCEALLPVYERLADHKLLEQCQRGKTQNSNESLHSVIWSLAPKECHASLHSVEAAVAEAVMRFNAGSQLASSKILQELNMTVGALSSTRMVEKDRRRTKDSSRRRTSAEIVQRTLKRGTWVIQKKPDEAKEVLKEAIERDPGNSRLYMQLADLGYEQSPPSEAEVLEAFEMATGSSSQLTAADKLVFLQRKLEFLEDFGSDVLKVQEAFDEYSKMAEAQELAASKKRPAERHTTTSKRGTPTQRAPTTRHIDAPPARATSYTTMTGGHYCTCTYVTARSRHSLAAGPAGCGLMGWGALTEKDLNHACVVPPLHHTPFAVHPPVVTPSHLAVTFLKGTQKGAGCCCHVS
ncbi:hypothetical protein HPB48_018202 [Haemaphysalis longicornis]|uniref:Uncharacterized protein n=1 Tax=Haemaphysalis longicornis TaxID=44386 RepID=A0A9J6GP30_HAELO|nr:hypothetical protein HPB48_018202 [Haemaphysalis longicornis]